METGVRKNTMKLCFEAGTRNPAHLEVLKFIVDSLKLSAADLHSVYKDENDGNFYLKFMDEVIFARFVNELDEHYRFRHNDGAESFVQLVPASRIFRYVRIFNLPPEIEDQAIASALRQYGTIRQHVRERYPLDYKFSVFSGVRGVHMEVSKEIPANLFVGHFRARIYYDGLKNRCFHCKEEGHLKSSCPKLATGSSGSGGSRTYSSVTARGTPAPSPVLLVPEFRPEMQVLNKKQATDSNNVKETVEAEATITDPVVVPAAIPVAPPLASPVAPPPGCPVAPPTAIPAALPPASPAKDDVPAGPSKSPAEIMAVLQRMAQEAEESMDTSNPKLAVKRSANSSTDGEENGGEDGFKPVIPKGKRSKKSKKKTPLSTIETRATAKGSV